jgi:DNA-binding MarR family transcriptional regulator
MKQIVQDAIEIQIYSGLFLKYFNQALEERLNDYGENISGLQHGILRMLKHESLTISDISRRLSLDPSTVVRAVDSLERKLLAQRGTDPNDRRRNPLSITDKGNNLVKEVPVISTEDAPFQALSALGVDSVHQLRDLLREVIGMLPEGKLVISLMEHEPNSS